MDLEDDDLRSRRREVAAERVGRARAVAALAASLADAIRDGDPGAVDGAQQALSGQLLSDSLNGGPHRRRRTGHRGDLTVRR